MTSLLLSKAMYNANFWVTPSPHGCVRSLCLAHIKECNYIVESWSYLLRVTLIYDKVWCVSTAFAWLVFFCRRWLPWNHFPLISFLILTTKIQRNLESLRMSSLAAIILSAISWNCKVGSSYARQKKCKDITMGKSTLGATRVYQRTLLLSHRHSYMK